MNHDDGDDGSPRGRWVIALPFIAVALAIGLAYLPHAPRKDTNDPNLSPVATRKTIYDDVPPPPPFDEDPKTDTSPVRATLPAGFGARRDDPPKLRGVSGLVHDARTRQPIPHAWITWRLPPPEVADAVLGDTRFRDPTFRMVTDAQGRFWVDRMPDDQDVSPVLYAVAEGYAYGTATPALREQVVFELEPMGSLRVEVEGANEPPPRVRLSSPDHQRICRALPTWGSKPSSLLLTHLPPGPYRVVLDPGTSAAVEAAVKVQAGRTQTVRLQRPRRVELRGTLSGVNQETELVLVDTTTWRRYPIRTDRLGGFSRLLPKGRYAAFAQVGKSEVRLPGTLDPSRTATLALEPPAPPTEVQLTRSGQPLISGDLGWVDLDRPLTSLVHLEAVSDRPGRYRFNAPPGRYGLFDGPRWLGEVRLPVPGPELKADPLVAVTLVFLAPGLRQGEQVRGLFSVVPRQLDNRPDLRARFVEATQQELRVSLDAPRVVVDLAPGRYLLTGRTDLGTLRKEIQVSGPSEVQIPLE